MKFVSCVFECKSYLHSLKISLIIYVFGNTFRCSMCCLFIYSKPIKYLAVNLGLACSFFFFVTSYCLARDLGRQDLLNCVFSRVF